MSLNRIEDALEDFRAGKMIIVVDDEDRENEGDLTLAAERITPEAVNFMIRYGRGLLCLSLTPERLEELQLPLMVSENTSSFGTAFTVSIEAKHKVTTGISPADRAATVLTAIDPRTRPADLARPGHVFPLRARSGGVLERAGQTEAAVDLARIAGMYPAGVICEIINDDGTMARLPQLLEFAGQHGLKIISIADLIQYRLKTEKFVREVGQAEIETEYGCFCARVFENTLNGRCHLAMVMGDVQGAEPVLVRVHRQSVLGDVFLSQGLPSGLYLRRCLRLIAAQGRGVVLYLLGAPDGRQLCEEFRSGSGWPEAAADPAALHREANLDYGIGAQILNSLGLNKIVLLSAHPRKFIGLQGFDLEIVRQLDIFQLQEEV